MAHTPSAITNSSLAATVECSYLSASHTRPLVLTPSCRELHLASWARQNRSVLDTLLLEHRALLFRGFTVSTAQDLRAFVAVTSDGEPLEYKDRSTPRFEVTAGVYVSTVYPREQHINLHNEGTYWKTWPFKLYFCCLTPAAAGGETPTADVRNVYRRLAAEVRSEFEAKQVMYVRNYNPGLGLTWKEAFQTDDPKLVHRYAEDNSIEIEWRDNSILRTRQVRPAVRIHPSTGEPLWFNHAAFFHISSLAPEIRDVLLRSYGEEGMPYNTYYGDGSPISSTVIQHIRDAYDAEQSMFAWQQGDILLLDNMSIAHGRRPYIGDRRIVVAMTEPYSN